MIAHNFSKLLWLSYFGFAREKVTTLFIFTNISLGNIKLCGRHLPARYGLNGPALEPKNKTQSESWEIKDMA
jgi:hypothetical protein